MPDRSSPNSKESKRPSINGWTRRHFLGQAALQSSVLGAGLVFPPSSAQSGDLGNPSPHPSEIRRRVTLGKTGIEVPDISFGTFSLETDEKLVHYALDRGITHFDTAESYTEGRAEEVLGRGLRGHRSEVTITSKYVAQAEDSAKRQMSILESSLRRLDTDYIDLYLNHAVNDIARLESEEWQTFVEQAKRQGKIRASGISGHAGRLHECLTYALDHQLADVILAAYNFAQEPSFQQRLTRSLKDLASSFDLVTTHPELPAILQRAHSEGVGVMVMKTLKGARQNDMRPFESADRTFSQAAFRWVLSNPAVDGLVVSMNNREMIDEYVEASGSGPPDAEDFALLARYESRNAGNSCLIGCGICAESCPASVPIPDIQRMRMYALDYGLSEVARREYRSLPLNAAACLECDGARCASACPNGLPTASRNLDTHRRLG
jgi:predicted aldo/keto reductase-like oxidoreductase